MDPRRAPIIYTPEDFDFMVRTVRRQKLYCWFAGVACGQILTLALQAIADRLA